MPPHPSFYPLPSSPTLTILDRFSLLPSSFEDASGNVPRWSLLHHLLTPSTPITTFPALASLLDTLAVTIHGTAHPAGDYDLLREAIAAHFPPSVDDGEGGDGTTPFLTATWPRLVNLALSMPSLFPSGTLPVLSDNTEVVLSRKQAGCLVVHQFLRTLAVPEWKREEEERMWLHDFGAWYGRAGQRQESAVGAYLGGLMRYFAMVDAGGLDGGYRDGDGWQVRYTLRSVGEGEVGERLGRQMPLGEVEVEVVERYDLTPRSLGLPGGAAVVAANRCVGFGQSATQEEVHVGSSPEACPAVLLTPPLGDGQVLVVRGAQATVNITGQRRDIRVEAMPAPEGGEGAWGERTMLFMDALELDMAEEGDVLPDLLPGNLDREIRKAYTAFSSGKFSEIRTGLWGCGAFCGDPGIKMLVLWLTASLAETKLVVVCDSTGLAFMEELQRVARKATDALRDTADLHKLLHSAPSSLVRGKTLSWVIAQLDGCEERM
ncbi:putative poly glycohydrolase [Staphylotrichum tortipilum]|uniref:poly(ADP-ribose) glycohydrolase n=1 Tax=Staphylotrichum tortipilum TaxID=2831512 RepID=A0AAN6RW89_9PEZI|nr:putative poly glycohydrolase [Staphylotrichum longicolle]